MRIDLDIMLPPGLEPDKMFGILADALRSRPPRGDSVRLSTDAALALYRLL